MAAAIAAVARGDAAQAAFDRKLSHYRNEIGEMIAGRRTDVRTRLYHDLDDSDTDTAIPDDHDDTVSMASYAYESV